MRKRQNYGGLDVFRLCAALLVIAIHTSPLASVSGAADFFLTRILARVAVPFFLMVTGQFVAAGFTAPSVRATARLHKFIQKTMLLYIFCILLYLPVGIYAGHYKDMTIGSALRMVLFDGTFYHLWYFPACILAISLVHLMSRFLSLRNMTIVSAILYLIGLFGDSYYGLAQKIPALETMYDGLFRIFSYTRNGLFLAPLFLVLGMWMAVGTEKEDRLSASPRLLFAGLAVSFAAMTAEAFTLRHFELQRHDSMYFALIPVMFFLYKCLLYPQAESRKELRTAASWIYILHPAFIVVVRGIARPLHLTGILVDNSLIHYIAVALLSAAAGLFISFVSGKAKPSLLLSRITAGKAGRRAGREPAYEIDEYDTEYQEVSDMQEDGYTDNYEGWDTEMQDSPEEQTEESEDFDGHTLENPDMLAETRVFTPLHEPDTADMQQEVDADDYILKIMSGRKTHGSQPGPQPEPPFGPERNLHGMEAAGIPLQYEGEEDEGFPESPCSRAWIELDAEALKQNVELFRARIPQNCRLMPAVKADAYGHGIIPIARLLDDMGIDAYSVACISEGITLRKAGITGKILILGYTSPEDFPLLRLYKLTQTVVDYPYAEELNRFGEKLHVHIGIDTGMHRIGIRCEELEEIIAVYRLENLVVDGLFTHLCVSDSPHPQHKAFTSGQLRAFYQVIDILKADGYPCPTLHILASYGILNLLPDRSEPDWQNRRPSAGRTGLDADKLAADFVRPGIALYGVLSTTADQNVWKGSLKPVLSLKAKVASIRPLHAGESVSYGITYTATLDMQIAAITIGYADGLPRELSNGRGYFLIHGHRAPIIGRICMDQCIVDISRIPDVKRGDTAVVIGRSGDEEITAAQIAETCGTITHEVLTGLAARLGRVVKELQVK